MFRIRRHRGGCSRCSAAGATGVVVRYLLVYLLLVVAQPRPAATEVTMKCSRTPEGRGAGKTPADGRFHVRISENTVKYTPGQMYTSKMKRVHTVQICKFDFSRSV